MSHSSKARSLFAGHQKSMATIDRQHLLDERLEQLCVRWMVHEKVERRNSFIRLSVGTRALLEKKFAHMKVTLSARIVERRQTIRVLLENVAFAFPQEMLNKLKMTLLTCNVQHSFLVRLL